MRPPPGWRTAGARPADAATIGHHHSSDPTHRSRCVEIPTGPEYRAWIAALDHLAGAGVPGIPPARVRDALAAAPRYRHLVAHLTERDAA
jgi:hypothetical protein